MSISSGASYSEPAGALGCSACCGSSSSSGSSSDSGSGSGSRSGSGGSGWYCESSSSSGSSSGSGSGSGSSRGSGGSGGSGGVCSDDSDCPPAWFVYSDTCPHLGPFDSAEEAEAAAGDPSCQYSVASDVAQLCCDGQCKVDCTQWYVDCYPLDVFPLCDDCHAGPFDTYDDANAYVISNPPPEGCDYTIVSNNNRNPLP